MNTRKLLTLLFLSILSFSVLTAQPVWVPTTPSIGTLGPTTIPINYGIDRVGTVYIVVANYIGGLWTSGTVKSEAMNPSFPQNVFQAIIPVTAGNINTILQVVADVVNANSTYTIYLVAESTPGGLQATSMRFTATTLPCPKIQLFTFFGNNGECVNLGAKGVFQAAPLPPIPTFIPTGVLKGTKWTIDWGDGTPVYSYTSTADDDIPVVPQHQFTSLTTCNYVGTWTVQNPCGEFLNGSSVFVVHGRDIPADGDGRLRIEETITHTPDIIYLCEGIEQTINVRDISTWNCQNPVVPSPLTAKPNIDPRTIQFVYGETPAGVVMNTITGTVMIGGSNPATSANGYVGPVIPGITPPNPNTVSESITIPATSVTGQQFYVYLKNWNKCNPYAGDPSVNYEYEDFIIEIIDAPPAPILNPPYTYCFGSVPATISATPNFAGNTINWYADAGLTTLLYTGTSYTHGQTAAGTYNYWVTETSGVNGCEGPAAQITMIIRSDLSAPGPISGPVQVCTNQTGVIFSIAADPPTMPVGGATEYFWTVPSGWTITAGQGSKQITVTAGSAAGTQTISAVTRYTTAPQCPTSATNFNTNLNPVATINSANTKTVCDNTPLAYTATSATPGCTFAWTRAVVAGISNAAGSGATALINESLDNTTTAPVNVAYIITPTINGCTGTPFTLTVTVNPTAVITSAATKNVCDVTPLAYTATSSSAGATFAWTRAAVAGISNAAGSGSTALINESLDNTTTADVNVTYIITPSVGTCAGTPFNLVVTVRPTAVITSAATKSICDNASTAYTITSSTAGATFAWTRAAVAGISNPAGSGTGANINENLDNTTTGSVNVTYVITPTYATCTGTVFNLVVTVRPTAVITSAATKTVCDVTPLAYTATSSTAGATFAWTRAVVAGISNAAGSGATALINESLDNTTTAPVNVAYIITPSSGGCAGTPFTLTVTVNPTAVITSAATKTVCDVTALAYTATSSTAGATFGWTRAAVAGISNPANSGLTALINESLDNTTASPVNVIYLITASYGGCAGTVFTLTVTVNPTTTVNSAATKTVCDVTPLAYTATSATVGATFAWTRAVVAGISNAAGSGATALINESLDNTTTGPVNATYIITPKYGACNGTPFNLVVTVNPTAVITSALTRTICSNTALGYTITSSTAGATFAWSRAAVAGISNPAANGTGSSINESLINTTGANVNVTYVLTPGYGGCAGIPSNLVVTVHPQFTLAQLHDDISICNNTATNLNVTLTGGTSPYTVNYTRNGTAQTALTSYVSGTNFSTGILSTGSYVYAITSVTDFYGCPVQSTGTNITVTVGAALTSATLTGSGNACLGSASTLKSVITGGAPPYTLVITGFGTRNNYFSNTDIPLGVLALGAHNYTLATVTDACTNSISPNVNYSITIFDNPNISATAPATQTICNDGTATITLNSTVNNTIFNYTVASSPSSGYSWTAGKDPIAGSITDGDGNGTEILSRTLKHDNTAPVTVTYTITPTGPGATACPGAAITRDVVVNPTALITSAATKTVCDNTPLAYTATSSTAGATFAWTRAAVAGISNAAGSGATALINESLDNTTTAPVNVTYIITPSYGTCAGTPFNLVVTVNPTAVITSAATKTICDNASTSYTATSSTAGATFAWTRAVVAGISNAAGSGATSAINENLDNTTTAPVNVTYVITPSYGACAGTPFNLVVTVNPTAVITSAATQTVCDNTPLGYTATSSTAGATFAWTRAVVAGIANAAGSGATALINESLDNTTTAPVNVTYIITPSYGTCTGTPFNLIVTVNPTAVITSAATKTICDNASTAYTATSSTAGATFAWTRAVVAGIANAAGSGATSAINENLDNTTAAPVNVTYVITPGYGTCAGTPFNFVVTVNPTAVITSAATQTVCDNVPLGYTATSSTAGATFAWTRAAVAGISNAAGSGATALINESLDNTTTAPVNVTYIITPGYGTCAGTPFNLVVTVNPTAVITSAATKTICDNASTAYTATSSTAGATFAWTRAIVAGISNAAGSGSTSAINENLDNTTVDPVNVTYVITPGYGTCAGTPFNLVVTVNPTAIITSATTQTVCDNTPLGYTATSSTAGATFAWTRAAVAGISNAAGSGATALINESLDNTTTAPVNVTYVITPGYGTCAGTPFNLVVTVNPTAVITSAATQTVCDNVPLGYTATSSTAGATFAWTRAAVAGISNAAGSGATALINESLDNTTIGPVNVIYIITPSYGTCTGTPFTLTVTVNPTTVITSAATKTVCNNIPLAYTATSSTAGATFAWTRAVVAGISNPAGSGATANINESLVNTTLAAVNVTYVITPSYGLCAGTPFNLVVTVNPTVVITAGQNPSVCSGNPLNYQILLDNYTNPGDNVLLTWPAPTLSAGVLGGSARPVGSTANITDTFTNTSGGIGTATYTVTAVKDGCTGPAVNVVINVGSQPVLDPGLNNTVCSNTATGLTLKEAPLSVTPTYYNISSITIEPGLLAAGGNAVIPNATAPSAYLANDRFANFTGVNKTVTYRVQPILAPDCIGDPVDVVITIRPQPVIQPGQITTVCSGIAIGKEIFLIPANTPAGTLFNWNVPVMSDASVQGTAGVNVAADPSGTIHINDIINNYSSAPITATYMITPTSSFGCAGDPVPVVITINQEPIPQPISGRVNLCIGDKNIVYNVNPVGGSSFHWTVDPAVGTKTFDFNTNAILIDAALVAGSGNITVYETNSLGCSGDLSTLPVQVYSQPAPENIVGDAVVCALSTHTYSVTNRVGSIYNWTVPGGAGIIGDPSASTVSIIFGNVGGTILVRETNIAGCVTNHIPFAVTVNPLPTAIISNGSNMCDGGTRALNVAFNGTAPFDFTYAINGVSQAPISTSSNPYTINATLAGTYTIVNVTDNTGCTNTGSGSATITYFPKPTGIISGNAELCRGSSTTLTIALTGVAPFTFTYTDGTTPVTVTGHPTNVYTASVSPLVTSTYTLTSLTDFNNCVGVLSGSALINVNQPPSLSLTGTNLICYNVATGAVDMTIAGGTAPFGIAWTGPNGFTSPTEDISGLAEGYYAVTVTDSKGCTATANITLTQPPVLNASVAHTNVTCFNANDGTITISGATGGTGTYEYTINGTTWAGSGAFTGLAPGTYNVQIRDLVNPTCILTLNPALVITQPPVLNATLTKTDITCFGANNGSIIISNPTGGYGTYQYTINGGTTWVGSGNFTNLTPGSYNVIIRDAVNTGCAVVLDGALVVTEPPVLSATVNRTNITCFASSDGTITISGAAGGHGTYEYSINGGGSWQATGNYTGLTPGTYNVQIRDAAYTSCYIVLNNALVLTQPAVLTATLASTNVTCNAANDGTISITGASGGYGTYEYTINGGTNWFASGLFTNVAPGTYDVRIRDAVNTACVTILNAGLQITEPAALMAMVIDTDITCFGANDGVITITNSAGGYGTFQYSNNGGSTWQDSPVFSSLSAGAYDVRIRDRAHQACVVTLNPAVLITEPAALSANVVGTAVTCNGSNDGSITISGAAGGYGTYQYSINGGASWQGSGSFTGLTPGSYNVRMRDAVNPACMIVLNPALVITEPIVLSASVARTNVTCFGAADGTITISGATGGYGTYEYTIDGGATWQGTGSFTSLSPGFYNVRIRDAAHIACVITLNASLNITEPAVLSANVARTNVSCNGANDGTITITNPLGGYGTYEYSINGGGLWQASGTFTNLAPATYNVQIRDAAHPTCIITLNGALVITEPLALGATVTPTMISCFGANNGIIAITNPVGGYGAYEYTVNGGTTWSSLGNFTNLAPGTYDVRMRDAAHTACTLVLNAALVITQPAVLNAVIASTNVTCFGGSDGTITITNPTGGYGTYEYTVNGGGAWQATGSFTGLGPGTYNVQIRDAAHPSCVIVLNNALVITQPAILRATVTPTMVTCFGANDGIITITNSLGGYGTYEYSNNGGTTWQSSGTFSGLAPANYDVRIRDAVNPACEIVLNPGVTITEPAILSAVVASTDVTCFGANDGIINITSPTGGYGTYEYSRNGGATWQLTGTFSSLAPGSYDVRIRDRAHLACVIVLNPALVITQPAVLSATVTSTNVTCNSANDGTITITNPLGGYGTYAYTISGGASWQTTGTFTNLAPGTYNVRIRDAAHITCEIVLDPALVITQPDKLSANVDGTAVTCNGANDSQIEISGATGGYGTYDYSIDGGANWQAGGSFTALAPGFYNVQIRDAAHPTCIVTLNGSLRITEPSVLSANVAGTNVTCNGANDGRITITGATGGYGTYEYSVTGGTSWQASGTFTGLTPGSYNVQIRDAAHTGCIIVLNPALVITEPAPITATVTPTNVTCFGANNGIITITGTAGGYGTYEYSINGGTNWSGLNNFTSLAPGTYDVRIRDAAHAGCVITLNPALLITQPAVLHADVAKNNVTCFGGSDGTITITNPTGGYGTYEYSVNGGGSWQASGVFTALGPGNYNVQIRDAAHLTCVIVLDNALQITQPAILNAVISTTMVTCNGASDGIINITSPTGGYGTYEYSNNGGTSWQASGTFTGLAPATYDVRIRDAVNTGCVITLNPSVMITEPSVLNAVVTSVNVTCFGANNGIIIISSPTGGYGTYEYSVTGGGTWQTTGTFSNLAPGTYDVRIRDRAHTGCVIVLNPALVITEPAVLSASVVGTAVTCNGLNDGMITITNPLGGYGTYQYTVNGGAAWQTSGTFNFLAPGTYNVRIRDAANITCEIVLDPALAITQPAKLAASVSSSNVTCYGANDGTISITAPTGGYGTYEYSIDGGTGWQAGGSFTALAPGFYNVQIRDAAHLACIVILNGSLRITEPPVLTANVTHANVTCNGANNGTITITSPMGGYGTYEYSNNGGTSWQSPGTFSNLAPGTYDIRIRDAANIGCVIVLNPALVITEPAVLNATVTSVNVSCFGANDGSISVSAPTGGYGTYQYSDNGGTIWQGFGNFTNLAPGTYDVRIRDAANTGCVITLNPALVITQPAILAANITSTNVTCFGGNDGTITINGATGGYGTYEYSINGGGSWQAPGTFNNLAPGTYNVMIRDAAHAGCIIVLNNAYMITQPGMLSATINKTEVSCHGNNDGTISITSPAGGYGTYEYSIDGGTSWQVSGNYIGLAPATYDVRIRDAAHTACSVILYPNLLITEPITLSMSSTGDVLLDCFGDMDGMGTFYASGGTMPYTFVVVSNSTGGTIAAPGFNSQTFFNAGAGSVTVSVVDFNGCSAQATINITQPAQLNPGTIAADQVICYGDNPAMLTESSAATGGPSAYNFQWQSSTNIAGPFINIAGATLNQYTPPAGAAYTLYYRRMVTSGICMPQYSNVVEVLVNPRPVALLTGGETICPGQSSVIRVTMLAGTGPFTVEIANHGVVNNYISGADIVVTPAVTTTYTLTRVRDANNCEVVSPSPNLNGTATVTVSDLPVITSFTPSPAVCEFTLASFKVTATGTNLTYQWFVNEGSGFNAVVDGGTYFGAMTPTLQIFNTVRTMNGFVYHVTVSGCGTSVTSADAVFTVNTAPELTLHPKDSTICLGQNAVMEADATGTSVTWRWYVNKGSGFVLSVDDANFSGSATRTLTITNAQSSFNNWVFRAVATGVCGVPVNTNFAVLRVVNPPAATLQPVAHTICENGSTSFLGNGTGYTSLQWQVFSGGVWTNLTDNATYIGTNTQQLAIMNAPVALNGNQYRLALITGCATTYSNGALLTVNANPVVDFSAVDPISACGGIPAVLNGNPTGGSGTYTQHRWTGDVGPLNSYTVQSPTFNSQITASYNLNYRVTDSNGCTANDDVTVTVDSPSAQFTQDVDYGCTPLTVTFTKDMTGLAKWWWNFDDGSPLDSLNANPVHTFINNVAGSIGYYNVKLKVRSPGGCYAEFTSTITVYPAVDATFTPNVPVICSGNSITFTALSGATRYFWEYGDGTSGYATHISSHLYTNLTTNPVVHTVKLTTTSFYNCVDVKTFDITVMPVPIPQFTADPLTQVFNAAGNPVTFTNTTNAGTWNWLWRFGDNTTSTAMSPVHSYTDVGTWSVTLVVSNANCSDSVKHSVSVVPPAPVAGFDSIPSGCAPLYVNINNTSLNTDVPGTTYRWDFGDGTLSTAKNPTYTYFTAGTYRIELVVTGPGGTSMATQVVNAYASPKAYFEITPPMVYVNDERVRCFNLSQGATSYLWDFGDGDTSKVKEPYHRYMEEGIFDITLWAYSENGCTDTYVLSPAVTVEPVGELRFSTVFTPNKTGPIERADLPTGGIEVDQFFFPPIRQKVLNYKLQIFNRLGVLIFQSNDINVPWNGYYKGNLCQQGVYVWYVEGKYADGKPFKMVGSVTLLQ